MLQTGSQRGTNVVAFGGGVASSLVLYVVHAVFEGRCVGVFVWLPGTTDDDWRRAQYLASFVGAPLHPPRRTPQNLLPGHCSGGHCHNASRSALASRELHETRV